MDGQKIRDYRHSKEITLKDLARELGITESALSLIETGKRRVQPPLVKKLYRIIQPETATLAQRLWKFHLELKEAGFTDQQATELVSKYKDF